LSQLPIVSNPKVEGGDDPEAAALLKRFDKAHKVWDNWKPIWQDVYDLCLPNRTGFYATTEGKRNTLNIFDDTAVTGAQEFASKIVSTMMPDFMRWIELRAGRLVPAELRDDADLALAEVTGVMFEVLNSSNFNSTAGEAALEMAMSTGIMAIEDGDANDPIRCTAVPLTQMVLDKGPFGETDFWARPRKIKAGMIAVEYPRHNAPEELLDIAKNTPEAEQEIVEVTYRDWQVTAIETFRWCAIWKSKKVCIAYDTFQGLGSCPWIDFSWSKDPAETYGRGPLLNALSSIKTANLTVQLTLENAEMAITGMWQYDDDGVINPDNVQFVPSTMIPKDPQSKGLQPLEAPGNFNVSNIILENQRASIKRSLYVGEFAPLDKTPMSATEVAYRMRDLAERIGAAWGRLHYEWVTRVVQRVIYLLRRQGRITIPRVDGHTIKIVPISPLAKAQNQADIMGIDAYLEQIQVRLGPNIVPIVVDPLRAAGILAKLHGVPPELPRSPQEAAQLKDQMMQLIQQGAAQGPGAAQGSPALPVPGR
jgi:hypothetical protein